LSPKGGDENATTSRWKKHNDDHDETILIPVISLSLSTFCKKKVFFFTCLYCKKEVENDEQTVLEKANKTIELQTFWVCQPMGLLSSEKL
jgi:hypothetical protein